MTQQPGPAPDQAVTYRQAPLPEGTKPLAMEIHRPAGAARGTILYFHPGGFFTGAPSQGRVYAEEVTTRGFVLACAEYRMKQDNGTLAKPWAGLTRKLRAETPEEFALAPRFVGRPAHTATEDGLAALDWVSDNLPKPVMLLGVSAGGIMAANIAFLAPALGLLRPKIAATVIISGALANVDQCNMAGGPAMYWIHGRYDKRVPFGSAAAVQKACMQRKAPSEFQYLDHKAHGTWVYRGKALPGDTPEHRRAPIWDFFEKHVAFQEK